MNNVIAIPLNGLGGTYTAYVDRSDADRVNQYRWRVSARKADKSGMVRLYVVRSVRRVHPETGKITHGTQYLHRFILDAPEDRVVDHKNHNTLDNTRSNLRLATRSQNSMNTYPMKRSKYGRGVWKQHNPNLTNPFRASIRFNGARIDLGAFKTAQDAAMAYDRAAIQYQGEFAILNYPNSLGYATVSQAVITKAA